MKRIGRKLLISICLSLSIVFIMSFATLVVYAYSASITYNYNVEAEALSISADGSLKITSSSDKITVTKFDAILTSTSESPIQGQEISKRANDKFVYQNLPVVDSGYTLNGVSNIIVVPTEATYTNADNETINIRYENVYVSSLLDIKFVTFQKDYNTIFSVFQEKREYAKIVYLINDLTIDEDVLINFPCSLDTLGYKLTLNNNLKIEHSYQGNYYVKGTIENTNNFSLIANNAYYNFFDSSDNSISLDDAEIITKNEEYSNLLDDALAYANNLIETRIYDDLRLPTVYKTYDVQYSYEISYDDGANYTSFYPAKIKREENNKDVKIKITATSKDASSNIEISRVIVGTKQFAYALTNEIKDAFESVDNNNDIELLYSMKRIHEYFKDVTSFKISVSESEGLKDDIRLSINDVEEKEFEITYNSTDDSFMSNGEYVKSFAIRKGLVKVEDNITLYVEDALGICSCELEMRDPSLEEVIIFLKQNASVFTTDKAYNLFNLRADGVYLGKEKISNTNLTLTNLSFKIITKGNDNDVTDSYFNVEKDDTNTYSVSLAQKSAQGEISNTKLVYYEGDKELFALDIVKAQPNSSGDNGIVFESNNPFDATFQNTYTNWLSSTVFEMPNEGDFLSQYAFIQILEINDEKYFEGLMTTETLYGEEYPVNIGKVLTVTGDASDSKVIGGRTYYKNYSISTNIDYVLSKNTTVLFKCVAIDEKTSDVTVEQEYHVTIPGIYKCSELPNVKDGKAPYIFDDLVTYDMTYTILSQSDAADSYVNVVNSTSKYILSNSSYYDGDLDFNALNRSLTKPISLTGLDFLVNVKSMNFDDIAISNMSSMIYYNGRALTEISMNNCSLTDAILFGDENNDGVNDRKTSYLAEIYLEKANFANNDIQTVDGLVFRTIKDLDLSNQIALDNINGISSFVNLVNVDLSNNNIYRFNEIKTIKTLKNVYAYNNQLGNDLYGSLGAINYPVYVWLIKTNNANIYVDEVNTSIALTLADEVLEQPIFNNQLSIDLVEGCVSLNAFAMQTKIYNDAEKTMTENDMKQTLSINIHQCQTYFMSSDGQLSEDIVFISSDYTDVETISAAITQGVDVSYIICLVYEDDGGNQIVLAAREFEATVYYNYTK